ncbi:MAG: toxin-antitoxin system YwqK family antitoxin [Cytophagales bacterium]|nr:toxin-antitoxin system YwqK family antitoxin [Cytophagales bacterium]
MALHTDGVLFFDGIPFTGQLLEEYANGSVKEKILYKNGLRTSTSYRYYESGQLFSIRTWKEGKKHGVHRGFFPNGSQRFLYSFEQGMSTGNHKEWYKSGQLASDMNYQNGKATWRAKGVASGWQAPLQLRH